MKPPAILLCLAFAVFVGSAHALLPIVIFKGLFDTASSMDPLVKQIKAAFPEVKVTVPKCFPSVDSLAPIVDQLDCFERGLLEAGDPSIASGKKILMSFSQGGVVSRAVLARTPSHGVTSWIALSSPHVGQFGLEIIREELGPKFANYTRDDIYKFFYSKEGQDLSVGNYWRDPRHIGLYLAADQFLPVLNNETSNPLAEAWRSNLAELGSLTLVGGPQDGIISPWFSALFDYWDDAVKERVDMSNFPWYRAAALDDINARGDLHRFTINGVEHLHWKKNTTVFKDVIGPAIIEANRKAGFKM